MQFKTVLHTKNISTYWINDYLNINKDVDIDTMSATFIINWSIEIDARDWGIKDISTNVISVYGSISWCVSNDDLTEIDIAQVKAAGGVLYNNNDWEGGFDLPSEWESSIINSLEFSNGSGCYPSELEIDFRSKVYSIS